MNNKIMELLKDGNTRSIKNMAEELSVSIDRLVAELEYLEHIGYIKKTILSPDCNGQHCKDCHGCDYDNLVNRPAIWTVL